ncbi:MAG: metallophosphoesterase family protein [Promethearchaeota archaeon]
MQLSPPNSRISFLHASDLHLGSSQYTNPTLSHDYLSALEQILKMALDKRVNFILLGGDVFTSRDVLPSIFNETVLILQNFHNDCQTKYQNQIPIIAIEGNHDIRRYSHGKRLENKFSWLQVLHNLGLLILLDIDSERFPQEGFQSYDGKTKTGGVLQIGDVKIFGTSFTKYDFPEFIQNCYKHIPDPRKRHNPQDPHDPNPSPTFNIFLQHFGIAGQMKNVPGKSFDLIKKLRRKVHYLGLGHYHKGFEIGDWIYNPGSAEAVSAIETTFRRGIFHCEITQNRQNQENSQLSQGFSKRVTRIPLNNRKYYWISIQLPINLRNAEAIYKFLRESIEKQWRTNFGRELKYTAPTENPRIFLVLRGIKPRKFSTHIQKQLKDRLAEEFSVCDIRFYLKFTEASQSLDKFLSVPIKYQKQQIPSQ